MGFNSGKIKVDEPSKRKKNPNEAALQSELGYSDGSPYRNRPYLDINTPEGLIDMSNTGIPLMVDGQYMGPYSGIHPVTPGIVREERVSNWLDQAEEGGEIYDRLGNKRSIKAYVPKAQTGINVPPLINKEDSIFFNTKVSSGASRRDAAEFRVMDITRELEADAKRSIPILSSEIVRQLMIERAGLMKGLESPVKKESGGWLDKFQTGGIEMPSETTQMFNKPVIMRDQAVDARVAALVQKRLEEEQAAALKKQQEREALVRAQIRSQHGPNAAKPAPLYDEDYLVNSKIAALDYQKKLRERTNEFVTEAGLSAIPGGLITKGLRGIGAVKKIEQAITPLMRKMKPTPITEMDDAYIAKNLDKLLDQKMNVKGQFNAGVYTIKNNPDFIAKIDVPTRMEEYIPEYGKLNLVELYRDIDNPNIAKIFKQIPSPTGKDRQLLVMNKVTGQALPTLSSRHIKDLNYDAIKQLYDDLKYARNKGFGADYVGHGNILYDPKLKKFGVVDLTPFDVKQMDDWWEQFVLRGVTNPDKLKSSENIKQAMMDMIYHQTSLNRLPKHNPDRFLNFSRKFNEMKEPKLDDFMNRLSQENPYKQGGWLDHYNS